MGAAYSKRSGVKRQPMTFKLCDDLRAKLDASAVAANRTLGNEIERRVERSFEASQAPSFEDVRLMIREEIRAALRPARDASNVLRGPHPLVAGQRGTARVA